MWEGVKGLFDAGLGFVTGIFSAIWSVINKIFDKVADWFGEKFRGAWKAIKNAFSNVGSFFSGIWDKIRSVFKSIGVKIGSAVGSAFKSTVNSVIRFAQGIINSFIGGLNKVVKIINKIPGVSISLIPKASLPKLADGGILEAGQMFIARERGPELVGSFGSRSGVMNNGQIVEAVSRGVFEAVKSAMSGGEEETSHSISTTIWMEKRSENGDPFTQWYREADGYEPAACVRIKTRRIYYNEYIKTDSADESFLERGLFFIRSKR